MEGHTNAAQRQRRITRSMSARIQTSMMSASRRSVSASRRSVSARIQRSVSASQEQGDEERRKPGRPKKVRGPGRPKKNKPKPRIRVTVLNSGGRGRGRPKKATAAAIINLSEEMCGTTASSTAAATADADVLQPPDSSVSNINLEKTQRDQILVLQQALAAANQDVKRVEDELRICRSDLHAAEEANKQKVEKIRRLEEGLKQAEARAAAAESCLESELSSMRKFVMKCQDAANEAVDKVANVRVAAEDVWKDAFIKWRI